MKYITLLLLSLLMISVTACSKEEPITENDIQEFIRSNRIEVVDYRIESESIAVILEVDGPGASIYRVTKHKQNLNMIDSSSMSWAENENGVSMMNSHGYLSVVIHDKAINHDMDFFYVGYMDEDFNRQKDRFSLKNKRGALVEFSSKYKDGGMVGIHGNDGFIDQLLFYKQTF